MRENNPTKNPATVAKISQSKKGRTFLSRGGNGQLTKPQILLAGLMKLPTEYVIETAGAIGVSLPHHYKVDLAVPSLKLAIEVDGNTHKLKRWRFLDHRKTEALASLGWLVIRFWNEEILRDPSDVVRRIQEHMSARNAHTSV
jgi:hypothetical protein